MSAVDFLAAVEARANDPYLAPAPWRSHAWTNGDPSNGPDLHHVEVDGWTSLSHAQAVVAETEYNQEGAAVAEFIAHARTDVPRLVAALRAVLDACHEAEANTFGDSLVDIQDIEAAIESALEKEER